MYLCTFTHIHPQFSKHDGVMNRFQIEDIVKQPRGKRKRPFQIEDIHDICVYLHIFTQNSRKLDGATKPFSNRRYCETTKGEAEKNHFK